MNLVQGKLVEVAACSALTFHSQLSKVHILLADIAAATTWLLASAYLAKK